MKGFLFVKKDFLLFDLDGTIIDSQNGILDAVQYTLRQFGTEEKRENQAKFPVFHGVQTEDILEGNGKAEQQPVKQSEQKPEKKTSLLRKLDEKKKECAERDAKQQAVKNKRNREMSL